MSVTNIVFYFALMAVFIAEAAVLCRVLPLQRQLTEDDRAGGRVLTLDGLRGILALSVFLHHAVFYYYFEHTSRWSEIPSNFYAQMGVLPVTLFFFITGYLFWSKLRKRPTLNFGAFMQDRIGRLGGAYFFACLLLFGFVAAASDFHRQVSWSRLVLEVIAWFSFLGAGHDMNAVFDSKRLLGQVWTLRLEWMFYLSLPFLGWFARRRLRLPLLLGAAAVLSLVGEKLSLGFEPANYIWKMIGNYAHVLVVTFSIGMIVAAAPITGGMKEWARSRTATVLSAILLVVTALAIRPGYGLVESLMLAIPFACVCFGNTWFGLLTSSPLRSLGRVSYSVYLLHVFVLDAGMAVLSRFVVVAALPVWQYWSFIALFGVVAVFISYLSYQFLEHPFLKKTLRTGVEIKPIAVQPAVFETPLWL